MCQFEYLHGASAPFLVNDGIARDQLVDDERDDQALDDEKRCGCAAVAEFAHSECRAEHHVRQRIRRRTRAAARHDVHVGECVQSAGESQDQTEFIRLSEQRHGDAQMRLHFACAVNPRRFHVTLGNGFDAGKQQGKVIAHVLPRVNRRQRVDRRMLVRQPVLAIGNAQRIEELIDEAVFAVIHREP